MIKYLLNQNGFYLVFKIFVISLLTSLILLTNFSLLFYIDGNIFKALMINDDSSRITFNVIDTIGFFDPKDYDKLDTLYQSLRSSEDYRLEYVRTFDYEDITMDVIYYQEVYDRSFVPQTLPCYLVPEHYTKDSYEQIPVCGNNSKIKNERNLEMFDNTRSFVRLIDSVYYPQEYDITSSFFNSGIQIAIPNNKYDDKVEQIKLDVVEMINDFYAQFDTVPTIYINDEANQQRANEYNIKTFHEEYLNRNIALMLLTFVTLFILNQYFIDNNLRYLSINSLLGISKKKAFLYFGWMNILTSILSGICIYSITHKILIDQGFYALWFIVTLLVILITIIDNLMTLLCLSTFKTSRVNQILRSKESE